MKRRGQRSLHGKSVSKKGRKKSLAPKWEREGYSSYRQYLNARYKELGFASYSEYTRKRERGEVSSTKPIHGRTRQLPEIGGMQRIEYTFDNPYVYDMDSKKGAVLAMWLRGCIASILQEHKLDSIYSGAWRIFGRVAMDLDEDGNPIWSAHESEEWSSHQEFEKMANELYSIARAYGDHEYIQNGRQIGKGDSRIYALIITRVRVSIILLEEAK